MASPYLDDDEEVTPENVNVFLDSVLAKASNDIYKNDPCALSSTHGTDALESIGQDDPSFMENLKVVLSKSLHVRNKEGAGHAKKKVEPHQKLSKKSTRKEIPKVKGTRMEIPKAKGTRVELPKAKGTRVNQPSKKSGGKTHASSTGLYNDEEFGEQFLKYANTMGQGRKNVITKYRNLVWFQNAGLINKSLTADKANELFAKTAESLLMMDVNVYKDYLREVAKRKRVSPRSVMDLLCDCEGPAWTERHANRAKTEPKSSTEATRRKPIPKTWGRALRRA